MKAKILLSVIMSTVLLLVLCAFAQGARQDRDALTEFQTLNQEGFDVTPGAAEVWNPLEDFCDGKSQSAGWVNSGPYLILNVPESAEAQTI